MVMMDEFQQMGAMPFVEETIHSIAGYGGRFAIIAQSLAAIDELYGPSKRRSLEAGTGLRLFITPRDEDTVAEVSRAVGSCTREAVTRSYGARRGLGGLRGQSVREEERPLLSETEARTLDADEVVLVAPPQMPIRARRIRYYEDPTFQKITEAQEAYPWPSVRADERGTAAPRGEETAKPAQTAKPVATAPKAAATPLSAERTMAPPPAPEGTSTTEPREPAPSEGPSGKHGDRPIEKRPRDEAVPEEARLRLEVIEERMDELAARVEAAVPTAPEGVTARPAREAAGEEGAAGADDGPAAAEPAAQPPVEPGAARRNHRLPI